MALYNIILPAVSESETARYAGLRSQRDFPAQLIKEACFEAKLLAVPKASWEIYDYDSNNLRIDSVDKFCLEGKSIINHLAGCRRIAVLAVTIGSDLETRAEQLFNSGSYAAGLLLDAAGSASVEAAADKVNEFISSLSAKEGLTTIDRYSPGYGDWNIDVQAEVLKLAGGAEIGIETTDSCMLLPRKSITAVIGLKEGSVLPVEYERCKGRTCLSCPQKNCLAREEYTL